KLRRPCAWALISMVKNRPRNKCDKTLTCTRKPGRLEIHREPSSEKRKWHTSTVLIVRIFPSAIEGKQTVEMGVALSVQQFSAIRGSSWEDSSEVQSPVRKHQENEQDGE